MGSIRAESVTDVARGREKVKNKNSSLTLRFVLCSFCASATRRNNFFFEAPLIPGLYRSFISWRAFRLCSGGRICCEHSLLGSLGCTGCSSFSGCAVIAPLRALGGDVWDLAMRPGPSRSSRPPGRTAVFGAAGHVSDDKYPSASAAAPPLKFARLIREGEQVP